MGNLTLKRWVPYAPDIGNNRELPEAEQLLLEISTSMTSLEFTALMEAVAKTKLNELVTLATAFEPHVRMTPGHTIDGKPLATLADYFAAVCSTSTNGAGAILEDLFREVVRLNTVEGELQLFSQRRSGGSASTAARSAAQKGSDTAVR